jgi:hypothetical protein
MLCIWRIFFHPNLSDHQPTSEKFNLNLEDWIMGALLSPLYYTFPCTMALSSAIMLPMQLQSGAIGWVAVWSPIYLALVYALCVAGIELVAMHQHARIIRVLVLTNLYHQEYLLEKFIQLVQFALGVVIAAVSEGFVMRGGNSAIAVIYLFVACAIIRLGFKAKRVSQSVGRDNGTASLFAIKIACELAIVVSVVIWWRKVDSGVILRFGSQLLKDLAYPVFGIIALISMQPIVFIWRRIVGFYQKKKVDPNRVLDTLQILVELLVLGFVVFVVVLTLLSKKLDSEIFYQSALSFNIISSFLWTFMGSLIIVGTCGSYNDYSNAISSTRAKETVGGQNAEDFHVLQAI